MFIDWIFTYISDQKQRKHAITFDVVVMSKLKRSDYKSTVLCNFERFLGLHYCLEQKHNSQNLSISLHYLCKNWLNVLHKGLSFADKYGNLSCIEFTTNEKVNFLVNYNAILS